MRLGKTCGVDLRETGVLVRSFADCFLIKLQYLCVFLLLLKWHHFIAVFLFYYICLYKASGNIFCNGKQ